MLLVHRMKPTPRVILGWSPQVLEKTGDQCRVAATLATSVKWGELLPGAQWPWQQGGQDILALTLSDRRRHLGSLGQVWKVNVCSFNDVHPCVQ